MNWACQEILDLIDRTQPNLCICLGDTLDEHERVGLRPLTMSTKFFFEIADRCPLVVIIGNHDRENNSDFLSDHHPFIGLTRTPNITVVDRVVWDRQHNFIYVPYVPPGRFQEALATVGYIPSSTGQDSPTIPSIILPNQPLVKPLESKQDSTKESIEGSIEPADMFTLSPTLSSEDDDEGEVIFAHPRLIFAHQEFTGSQLSGTIHSHHGDPWSNQWPLVISGHIHEYQVLPGVIYVGTFLQQNYGESPDKALMMLHLPDDTVDRIGSVVSNMTIERVRLSSICPRQTIHLNMEDLHNFMDKIPADSIRTRDLKKSSQRITGTLVRVMLHVDAAQTKTLRSHPQYIALEQMVDKISLVPECDRASLALSIMPTKSRQQIERFSLEQMVREMIKDDPPTLSLFEEEILTLT